MKTVQFSINTLNISKINRHPFFQQTIISQGGVYTNPHNVGINQPTVAMKILVQLAETIFF